MPSADASNLKILVVDDDLLFLKLAEAALTKRGISVQTAEAGEEAIAKIHYEAPQIVLLDVKMPRLTGDELVKMIKDWKPEMHVFMVSSHLNKDIEEECLQNGAQCCIEKPVDFDQLIETFKHSFQ